ncbi:oxidoreductase C-terminal domain-containing protein, partial [Streptomyces sp. NPDC046924]|uniref:oxidoreductase C-terminal domain-containing protein n=1 Tax=Streptomyces sp. NPDC046924 TaxID=3155136 RepID=UPI0033FBF36B
MFTGHDTVILRGDPADGAFTTVCLAQGRVIALDCVDTAADFAQGKVLVDRSMEIDPRRTGRHVKAVAVLPGLPTAGSGERHQGPDTRDLVLALHEPFPRREHGAAVQ